MASSPILFLVVIVLFISASATASSAVKSGGQRKVGGRTAIENVEANREVQDLGGFCVEEYNRRIRGSGAPLISYSRVVAAERQVVSGVKYYLSIVASDPTAGRRRVFDAVVVVRPWAEAKELVSFAPSSVSSVGHRKNH